VVIVLFRAKVKEGVDLAEYEATFERMLELASAMPGFVGIEGFAAADGSELAVVRFESEETVEAWRNHPAHLATQQRGRDEYFDSFQITVASQIREYGFASGQALP
jgi:heme-degrading monooxygenase HmoA